MANPATNPDDTGLLAFDCGATSTITSSLYNMSEVVPKKVKIQLAQAGASMTSTHVGIKTYYVYDRTGSIRPIRTRALVVPDVKQDLLGGKALTNRNHRIILDDEEDIAGVYPKAADGSIDPSNSFPFMTRPACFICRPQLFLNRNMQKCRDGTCGIEDFLTVQTIVFARQLIIQLG
jgi:hypothetical protein